MRASPQAIIPSFSSSSPTSLLNVLLSLSLLFLPSVVLATSTSPSTTVTLTIPPSPQLPNPAALPPSTHATLSQLGHGQRGLLRAPLDASSAFVFRNVTPGSYLGDVHCGAYGFAPLRVDVVDVVDGNGKGVGEGEGKGAMVVRVWETFRGNDWDNRGEEVKKLGGAGNGGKAGFPVKVLGPKVYYMERGSFSVFGILKNPMILMGLVSMALFVGLPKLVENMDPEMRAEWEEQQKKNPMASLSSKFQ